MGIYAGGQIAGVPRSKAFAKTRAQVHDLSRDAEAASRAQHRGYESTDPVLTEAAAAVPQEVPAPAPVAAVGGAPASAITRGAEIPATIGGFLISEPSSKATGAAARGGGRHAFVASGAAVDESSNAEIVKEMHNVAVDQGINDAAVARVLKNYQSRVVVEELPSEAPVVASAAAVGGKQKGGVTARRRPAADASQNAGIVEGLHNIAVDEGIDDAEVSRVLKDYQARVVVEELTPWAAADAIADEAGAAPASRPAAAAASAAGAATGLSRRASAAARPVKGSHAPGLDQGLEAEAVKDLHWIAEDSGLTDDRVRAILRNYRARVEVEDAPGWEASIEGGEPATAEGERVGSYGARSQGAATGQASRGRGALRGHGSAGQPIRTTTPPHVSGSRGLRTAATAGAPGGRIGSGKGARRFSTAARVQQLRDRERGHTGIVGLDHPTAEVDQLTAEAAITEADAELEEGTALLVADPDDAHTPGILTAAAARAADHPHRHRHRHVQVQGVAPDPIPANTSALYNPVGRGSPAVAPAQASATGDHHYPQDVLAAAGDITAESVAVFGDATGVAPRNRIRAHVPRNSPVPIAAPYMEPERSVGDNTAVSKLPTGAVVRPRADGLASDTFEQDLDADAYVAGGWIRVEEAASEDLVEHSEPFVSEHRMLTSVHSRVEVEARGDGAAAEEEAGESAVRVAKPSRGTAAAADLDAQALSEHASNDAQAGDRLHRTLEGTLPERQRHNHSGDVGAQSSAREVRPFDSREKGTRFGAGNTASPAGAGPLAAPAASGAAGHSLHGSAPTGGSRSFFFTPPHTRSLFTRARQPVMQLGWQPSHPGSLASQGARWPAPSARHGPGGRHAAPGAGGGDAATSAPVRRMTVSRTTLPRSGSGGTGGGPGVGHEGLPKVPGAEGGVDRPRIPQPPGTGGVNKPRAPQPPGTGGIDRPVAPHPPGTLQPSDGAAAALRLRSAAPTGAAGAADDSSYLAEEERVGRAERSYQPSSGAHTAGPWDSAAASELPSSARAWAAGAGAVAPLLQQPYRLFSSSAAVQGGREAIAAQPAVAADASGSLAEGEEAVDAGIGATLTIPPSRAGSVGLYSVSEGHPEPARPPRPSVVGGTYRGSQRHARMEIPASTSNPAPINPGGPLAMGHEGDAHALEQLGSMGAPAGDELMHGIASHAARGSHGAGYTERLSYARSSVGAHSTHDSISLDDVRAAVAASATQLRTHPAESAGVEATGAPFAGSTSGAAVVGGAEALGEGSATGDRKLQEALELQETDDHLEAADQAARHSARGEQPAPETADLNSLAEAHASVDQGVGAMSLPRRSSNYNHGIGLARAWEEEDANRHFAAPEPVAADFRHSAGKGSRRAFHTASAAGAAVRKVSSRASTGSTAAPDAATGAVPQASRRAEESHASGTGSRSSSGVYASSRSTGSGGAAAYDAPTGAVDPRDLLEDRAAAHMQEVYHVHRSTSGSDAPAAAASNKSQQPVGAASSAKPRPSNPAIADKGTSRSASSASAAQVYRQRMQRDRIMPGNNHGGVVTAAKIAGPVHLGDWAPSGQRGITTVTGVGTPHPNSQAAKRWDGEAVWTADTHGRAGVATSSSAGADSGAKHAGSEGSKLPRTLVVEGEAFQQEDELEAALAAAERGPAAEPYAALGGDGMPRHLVMAADAPAHAAGAESLDLSEDSEALRFSKEDSASTRGGLYFARGAPVSSSARRIESDHSHHVMNESLEAARQMTSAGVEEVEEKEAPSAVRALASEAAAAFGVTSSRGLSVEERDKHVSRAAGSALDMTEGVPLSADGAGLGAEDGRTQEPASLQDRQQEVVQAVGEIGSAAEPRELDAGKVSRHREPVDESDPAAFARQQYAKAAHIAAESLKAAAHEGRQVAAEAAKATHLREKVHAAVHPAESLRAHTAATPASGSAASVGVSAERAAGKLPEIGTSSVHKVGLVTEAFTNAASAAVATAVTTGKGLWAAVASFSKGVPPAAEEALKGYKAATPVSTARAERSVVYDDAQYSRDICSSHGR